MLDVTFSTLEDGQVDAFLGDEWPIFNDALGDSISSLPPRGALGVGPSTYWIDEARQGAVRAAEQDDGRPFIWGNITQLLLQEGQVVARYDYDEAGDPVESLPLAEFLELLDQWRDRVLESARTATEPLPVTYRRNPTR